MRNYSDPENIRRYLLNRGWKPFDIAKGPDFWLESWERLNPGPPGPKVLGRNNRPIRGMAHLAKGAITNGNGHIIGRFVDLYLRTGKKPKLLTKGNNLEKPRARQDKQANEVSAQGE